MANTVSEETVEIQRVQALPLTSKEAKFLNRCLVNEYIKNSEALDRKEHESTKQMMDNLFSKLLKLEK